MKKLLKNIQQGARTMWASLGRWLSATGRLIKGLWKRRDNLGEEMKHKQRFVVMDSVTFKERWSFQLSAINVFVTVGISIIVLVVLTAVLIAFTPLRELIPGYTNQRMTEQTFVNAHRLDSLEVALGQQERMMADLQDVLNGRDPSERLKGNDTAATNGNAQQQGYTHSAADSALREEVESATDRYSPSSRSASANASAPMDNTPALLLFAPLKGTVQAPFNEKEHHYGVDIAGVESQSIKAVAPGTVVVSHYTIESGYVLAIQHQGGMMSTYKHLKTLLKREGEAVRVGEPIGYLGGADQHGTGTHLHFELWVAGKPVNPVGYISF
ncbi:MAG: M23 family metallopeptidase [Bacteroidales bacterium]|nr:M23 family metallopeptidase [Bacteroidales bacterium]